MSVGSFNSLLFIKIFLELLGNFLDVCQKIKGNFLEKLIEKLQDAFDNAPQKEKDICEILIDEREKEQNEKQTVSDEVKIFLNFK